MSKIIISLGAIISLLFMACHNSPKIDNVENKNAIDIDTQKKTILTDIPFTFAKNYFVNNNVEKLDNPKIETVEVFNEIFGMATTMSKDGKPTEIDFDRQYVIAVILPETDLLTTIVPVSLQKDEIAKITLTYKTSVGQKQTYTSRPSFAIIVDKKENGIIELKEQK